MVLHLVPGNPAQVIAGPDAPPETVRQIEVELGLDKPQPEQYAIYLGRVVLGRHVLLNMGAMVSTARQYIATAPLRLSLWRASDQGPIEPTTEVDGLYGKRFDTVAAP